MGLTRCYKTEVFFYIYHTQHVSQQTYKSKPHHPTPPCVSCRTNSSCWCSLKGRPRCVRKPFNTQHVYTYKPK